MEENKFEQLEEIETDLKVENVKPIKAYEELLEKEYSRSQLARAIDLIKAGCFDQKQEPKFDYSKYNYLKTEKTFKGYKLYQNKEDKSLVLVYPLVENNKGADDERKDLEPYSFDVIYIDSIDDETFNKVMKAARANLDSKLEALYKGSFVFYIIYLVLFAVNFIFSIVYSTSGSGQFYQVILNILSMNATMLVGLGIITPLLALLRMKYRKYKNN